ncbi:hypothetical protein K458DRAFT_385369 [Lentithecium fluviatile CBS 122367]|uniref:Uncharacterized protein n=1 Tax=Lentithecium fluviatile CBS 122367 TaxID=1168545 RepID=A0A6G1JB58_9PLEO|nr:hypothetical protein K458DRAFT_385369 [Lentithecium fluviatile CBS 122367]
MTMWEAVEQTRASTPSVSGTHDSATPSLDASSSHRPRPGALEARVSQRAPCHLHSPDALYQTPATANSCQRAPLQDADSKRGQRAACMANVTGRPAQASTGAPCRRAPTAPRAAARSSARWTLAGHGLTASDNFPAGDSARPLVPLAPMALRAPIRAS